jgi:cardiolipin synthase
MKDGTKRAISGSHNFAYTGVLLGTREVALETADPTIIRQLETFLDEEVIGSKHSR